MPHKRKKLLIIGGGNMGYAIAKGILAKGLISKAHIIFIEKKRDRFSLLRSSNLLVFKDLKNAFKIYKKEIDTIILAVKPVDIKDVVIKLKQFISNNTPIISIAAGIKIKTLSLLLSKNQPIIRVMPNTPAQIGKGISALMFNSNVTKKQRNTIKKIFNSIGKIVELKSEDKFDIVTALSGSGPAYFCYLIELLINSGVQLGLNKKISQELVLETALGTISLLKNSNLTPENLRAAVTSPNGTTEAALKVFQKNNLNSTIYKAVKAAKNRAFELSQI